MNVVTVFTPTYNRSSLLIRLYNSLVAQTEKNFEWVIVDDGSTDNTTIVIESFVKEQKIDILYLKKVNGGKHTAINLGLKKARGDLFFIVDSDDYLKENAIHYINSKYYLIKNKKDFAGISGRRGTLNGNFIGTQRDFGMLACNTLDFRFKYKIKGDMAEIYKTNVLKKFCFPEFKNEKFCPEALVWNRLSLQYKMIWFSEIIYIGEYITGGLTQKIIEVRKQSPLASCLYYSELASMPVPILQKLKATINYWRFAVYRRSDTTIYSENKVSIFLSIVSLPFIIFMIIADALSFGIK